MELTIRIPIPWRRKDPAEYPKHLTDLLAQAMSLAIDNQTLFGDTYYQLRTQHAELHDELTAIEERLVTTRAKLRNCARRLAWYEAVMYRPKVEPEHSHKTIATNMRMFIRRASAAACNALMKRNDMERLDWYQPGVAQNPGQHA